MADKRMIMDQSTLFDQQWAAACQKPRECNPHQRVPSETAYRDGFKDFTHDRLKYLSAMLAAGDMPNPGSASDPAPGSAPGLQAAQDALILKEQKRLYAAAVEQKREVLEESADASFLSGLKDIQTMTQDSKQTLAHDIHDDERQRELAAQAEKDRIAHQNDDVYAMLTDREARQTAAYNYVKAAAGLACSNPSEFGKQIDQGKVVGVSVNLDSIFTHVQGRRRSERGRLEIVASAYEFLPGNAAPTAHRRERTSAARHAGCLGFSVSAGAPHAD